jgi:hypothetical protein
MDLMPTLDVSCFPWNTQLRETRPSWQGGLSIAAEYAFRLDSIPDYSYTHTQLIYFYCKNKTNRTGQSRAT